MSVQAPQVTGDIVWQGKWIRTKIVHYEDRDGIKRSWEAFERTNVNKSEVGGNKLFNCKQTT